MIPPYPLKSRIFQGFSLVYPLPLFFFASLVSCLVLLLWQLAHRGCRFDLSFVPPFFKGLIWSTTVAGPWQLLQRGSSARIAALIFLHWLSYPLIDGLGLLWVCGFFPLGSFFLGFGSCFGLSHGISGSPIVQPYIWHQIHLQQQILLQAN